MPLHYQSYQKALGSHADSFSKEMFYDQAGVPAAKVMALLKKRCDLDIDPEEIGHRKEQLYGESLRNVESIKPVEKIIRDYHGKLPMAVASGGTKENVIRTLELIDLLQFFDVIVSADDVDQGKPHPDMFLEAARRIDVEPTDCLVFEDGDKGIEAAKAGGMEFVDVRTFLE